MAEEREADIAVSYVRKVATGQYENAELRATSRVFFTGNEKTTNRKELLETLSDEVIETVHKKLEEATGKSLKPIPKENSIIVKPTTSKAIEGGMEEVIRKVESESKCKKMTLEDLNGKI